MMKRILHETNASSYNCFLTGGGNFRFAIYPEYKANRANLPKPKHWAAIREYLVVNWNAKVTDGHEADDAMGVAQSLDPDNSVICSIDKDMLMIPGYNYNFVKQEMVFIEEPAATRWLYYQALMGDKVDNIPGFDGKMRSKVPKKMQWMVDFLNMMPQEIQMYDFLTDQHFADVDLDVCLKCLWIWRKEGDVWVNPHERME